MKRRNMAALLLAALLLFSGVGCAALPDGVPGDPIPTAVPTPLPTPAPTDPPETPAPSTSEPTPTPEVEPVSTPAPTPAPTPESVTAPQLILSAETAPQGGALLATLTGGASDVEYSVYLPHLDKWIPIAEYRGERVAVLPVGMVADPGEQRVELYQVTEEGEEQVAESRFTVTPADYERQDLVTSGETQSLYTASNNNHDSEKLRLARTPFTPQAYFDGAFAVPLEGRRTTEFGMQRYVNDQLQSRHTGYDIGAPEGTEIRAAADGVVTMAEELIVYGNTVVLDHGLGVYTAYSHMSAILVDEGDYVEQGAVIGLVGETGYATGPHLHYTLLINSYYTDPAVAYELFE